MKCPECSQEMINLFYSDSLNKFERFVCVNCESNKIEDYEPDFLI